MSQLDWLPPTGGPRRSSSNLGPFNSRRTDKQSTDSMSLQFGDHMCAALHRALAKVGFTRRVQASRCHGRCSMPQADPSEKALGCQVRSQSQLARLSSTAAKPRLHAQTGATPEPQDQDQLQRHRRRKAPPTRVRPCALFRVWLRARSATAGARWRAYALFSGNRHMSCGEVPGLGVRPPPSPASQ